MDDNIPVMEKQHQQCTSFLFVVILWCCYSCRHSLIYLREEEKDADFLINLKINTGILVETRERYF